MADWLDQLQTYLGGNGTAGSDGGFLGRASRATAPQGQRAPAQPMSPMQLSSMSQLFQRPVDGTPWVTQTEADAVNNGPQDPNITAPPAVAGGAVGRSPFEMMGGSNMDPRMLAALSMLGGPSMGAGGGAGAQNPGLVSKVRGLF